MKDARGGTQANAARWAGGAIGRLERLPKAAAAAVILGAFALIVGLDVVTGVELTLRPLYLLPVAAGSWL